MKFTPSTWLNSTNFLKGVFYLLIFGLAVLTLEKYQGATYVYILFTLVFNILLLSGFRKKRIFFDTFIGIFMWLGFWFKLSFSIVFFGGQFGEPVGNFNFGGPAFDYVLNISSCGAFALLMASFLRQKYFSYTAVSSSVEPSALEQIYFRYRKPIWVAYAMFILLVSGSNAYFGFYQKGLPPRHVLPFGLSGAYTLSILFGLASVSAVLLNCEFKSKASPYMASVISLLECFFSNISMLSRGMILNGTALVLGALENARLRSIRLALSFKIMVLCVFFGLFLTSLYAVNYVRVSAFNDIEVKVSNTKNASLIPSIIGATQVRSFVNRWVGIEGVMSVTSYGGLGWGLWQSAWREKYSTVGTSLYDKNIIKDSSYLGKNLSSKHFITLPGIIAFSYYPGSVIFLFFAMFVWGLFAAGVEIVVHKLGGANIILCSLLGQVVAGRYVHFGYVPRQSYLLFGGIFLISSAIYALNKLIPLVMQRTSSLDK